MNWRTIFPWIFIFSCVDGFISNLLYPAKLPLLYRDFLVLFVYILFLFQEPFGTWLARLRNQLGQVVWIFAAAFFWVGFLQIFNPALPNIAVGLLGFKVAFFYWPLALLAFAYADRGFDSVRQLLKTIAVISIPINLFGLYQFIQGPEFLSYAFGESFERATVIAAIGETLPEESFLRIIGTFAYTGPYTSFLVINIIFCYSLLLTSRRRLGQYTWGSVAALSLISLLATGSRGGLISIVLAAFLTGIVSFSARRSLGLGFLIALSLYGGFHWLGGAVIERFETVRDTEMIYRRTFETTPAMFKMFYEEAFWGKGIGIGSVAARHLLGEDSSEWYLVENHLSKLQLETGIFGVAFFYTFVIALSLRWLRRWRSGWDPGAASLLALISAYCLTILWLSFLIGGFDTPPQNLFFWMLVGAVARLSLKPPEINPQTAP